MAPRFDPENLVLELSVADLLETPQLLRSLGFANRGGYERMWLGQAIHSRYQERAFAGDSTYRQEVYLTCGFAHRGWEVKLRGRADGLRTEADGTRVVEEIKSVRRGVPLKPAARELYERQALIYAWMLCRSEELSPERVRAELVLIEIGTDVTTREELETDFQALETGLRQRLNALIRGWEARRREEEARRRAAEDLTFPYPNLRPGQDEIVTAVETALDHGEHLLLEAPTGLGKTVAALFPALRYALTHGKRIFVLTAKTLQQDMAAEVLQLLNREGAFRSLRLRAKTKMCANDQILCHEEYCSFAKDYYAKLASSGLVPRLLREGDLLQPDVIYQAAETTEVCPFEVSLELGRRVQVTVCDYNYAFDPYVALSEFGPETDLRDTILIVDEIHNLVDRGRGYYSPELSAGQARRAAEHISRGGHPVHFRIEKLLLELAELIEETVVSALEEAPHWDTPVFTQGNAGGNEIDREAPDRAVETRLPEDRLWMLRRDLDAAFIDYLEHQRENQSMRANDPFVDLYFDYLRFLNVLVRVDHAFSQCAERRSRRSSAPSPGGLADGESDLFLRILCKDPSRFLGEVLSRVHTAVGLSATLSPPEFYRDLLGFERGRTAFVSVPSPFPASHRRVVIDGSVATTWRERPANYGKIAQRLGAFATAVPGNCLALFPSYQFLAEIATRLHPDGKRVLIQERAAGDREREAILDTLRSALLGDVLLLAVAGGVFAEGVDYPGEMLKAVAVVGPCLPALNLDQQLLRQYYDERFDRGFEYAFVVPGMTRVVQAAGRLIRSAEDTGVIALLDQRFLHRPYRRHLPQDWLPAEGLRGLTGDPARAVREFFEQRDPAPQKPAPQKPAQEPTQKNSPRGKNRGVGGGRRE